MADDQIEGLPEGATVRPIQPTPQATTDTTQVEGLPAGATVRPVAANNPPAVKTPEKGFIDQLDEGATTPEQKVAMGAVKGARGLYNGVMGNEESAVSRGKTSTASPVAENLGFTPEHLGHEAGAMVHDVGKFVGGVAKDLNSPMPIVSPNEPGSQAKAKGYTGPTFLQKYVEAPSEQERQEALKEAQQFHQTQGWEAFGHALNDYIHTAGEYVPMVGPFAAQLIKKAQGGDVGGALAQVAALKAGEKVQHAVTGELKTRAGAAIEEAKETPQLKQANANVEALKKELAKKQELYETAKAAHDQYAASHAQGIAAPKNVTNALTKASEELAEAQFHHDAATEHAAQVKTNQPTIPQQVGSAVGKTVAKVLPKPTAAPEVPAEEIEAAPVLQKLGKPKAPAAPINVKTPGQVQPETFPQEPTEKPATSLGRINLANEQGTVGKTPLLGEGTPEGPQVPAGGLPKIAEPKQEVLPPEKPTAKPERGNVKALTVDEKGNVIDKEETPEGKLQKLLEESLKGNEAKKTTPAPAPVAEPEENRSADRRVADEEHPGDERRKAERRVLKDMNDKLFQQALSGKDEGRIDTDAYSKAMEQARKELGPDASVKDVMKRRDELVAPEAKGKQGDIGEQSRQANPEPTRAETKTALPKEDAPGYSAKKEDVVPAGSEGREDKNSGAVYHAPVKEQVTTLSDENLKKLATAHGLNPEEYDFKARDERRHRVERDQLVNDVMGQMGDDELHNIGRAASRATMEPDWDSKDKSSQGRADKAAKLFPRLRGPVDEYGNPIIRGGSQGADEEADKLKEHVAKTSSKDTDHVQAAMKALGPDAKLSDIMDRAQKMKAETAQSVDLKKTISDYNKSEGLGEVKDNKTEVDPRGKEIARAYDDMKHDPSNPEVKKSYDALINDAKKQWDALTKAGIKLEPTDEDPYKSYDEMKKDFNDNKRLKVFRGGNELPKDHPLAQVDPKTGETYNVMFRAVHDAIGHLMHDNDFTEKGEQNAFDTHRQTMSKDALPAMTTETKGQVASFFNNGEKFPEQKAGILPDKYTGDAPDPKAVIDHLKSGKDYALLTAENPNNERATPEQNAQKNQEMKAELEKMGYKPTPIEGHVKDVEGQKENSFFVPDITPEDAAKVSRKFGQASVMTKQGIHDLVKDMVHPSTGVLESPEAEKQDYHSTVAGKPFSVSVDFDKEEKPSEKTAFKTTNRHAEDLSYEHKPEGIENSNQQHRVITSGGDGKKIGEVSAQDTAAGEVTVRSDQVYDQSLRGSGRGYDQMKHLLDRVSENKDVHTIHSDISNSTPERGVWEKLMKDYPDAITKEEFKDGQTQYTVDTEAYAKSQVPSVSGGSQSASAPAKAKALPKVAEEHLTPEEKAGVTKSDAGRKAFVDNLKKLPSVQEFIDIAKAGEGGRKWYQRSASAFDALSEEAPKYFKEGDRQKFTDFLASLSPQQSVKMNLGEALNAWTRYVDEGRPTGKELEKLLKDEVTLPGAKVPNAMKSLAGEPLWPDLSKNSNFKVPSFAKNLNGYLNHVTNDGWQALFGGLDAKEISRANSYHPLAVVTREAAKALGWEPAEAQAAIWAFTKTFTEKGETDPADIRRRSEDFADILALDPEIRQQLAQLGVNHEQLDAKLRAIGKKPPVTPGASPTTENSVGKLAKRIEGARGKGTIPPPKSGNLNFDDDDEATGFNPEDFGSEDNGGLAKLGDKKKKSPLGRIK